MRNNCLKIIDSENVWISGKRVKAGTFNPPYKDGNAYLIEATSNAANNHQQQLLPSDLSGLTGEDIPKGFQLIIYEPETRTSGLDFFCLENLSKGARIILEIRYQFAELITRINLADFERNIQQVLENELENIQSIRPEKDEAGISFRIARILEPEDDIFEAFASVDRALLSLHKRAIKKSGENFSEKLDSHAREDGSELKWWLRFVAVPIISGGVGAAIVASLLRGV